MDTRVRTAQDYPSMDFSGSPPNDAVDSADGKGRSSLIQSPATVICEIFSVGAAILPRSSKSFPIMSMF